MNTINVSQEAYKKIKKGKKIYYYLPNGLDLNLKEKVIVVCGKKHTKKIVKNIYSTEFDELKDKYVFKEDNPNGVSIVEFRPKKKIIRKTIAIIFLLILLSAATYFGLYFYNQAKARKMQAKVEKVMENKPTYVYIKINPELILELVTLE